jgi:hypothetical protein
MSGTRFEKRHQIAVPVQTASSRLIDANLFRQIAAAGLEELTRPEAIEHVAADGQIASDKGQEGGGTQDRFRLQNNIVIHQQNMGRGVCALRFEKTAREAAGPATIVLFNKLQSSGSGSCHVGKSWMIAHFFSALIDDDDALQHLGNIQIGKESIDIADKQSRAIERAKTRDESNRTPQDLTRRPFGPVYYQTG